MQLTPAGPGPTQGTTGMSVNRPGSFFGAQQSQPTGFFQGSSGTGAAAGTAGGTSLFGGSTIKPSLFGNKAEGTSMFGGSSTQSQSTTTGTQPSLFGGLQSGATGGARPQPQTAPTSLFGAGSGGTTLFGGSSNVTSGGFGTGSTTTPAGAQLFSGTAPSSTTGPSGVFGTGAPSTAAATSGTSLFPSNPPGTSVAPTSLFSPATSTQGQTTQSLFGAGVGQSVSAKPSTSLFGTVAPSSSSPSSFFGTGTASTGGQAAVSGASTSLFGSSSTSTTGVPSSTGATTAFGVPGATTTSSQQSSVSGLFGGTTSATQQPLSSSLFGATTSATQQSLGSSLFGGITSSTQQPSSSSPFGGTGSAIQQPSNSSLFGGTGSATQQPSSSSLFGGTGSATQQPPSSSLFGGTSSVTQQAQPSQQTLNSTLFGSGTQQSPSTSNLFGAAKPAAAAPVTSPWQSQQQATASGVPGVVAAKRFLPYAPSVKEFLTVVPEWKPAFEAIANDASQRHELINRLRTSLSDLSARNDALKVALSGYEDKSRSNVLCQSWTASEAEAVQQAVWKLHRQASALSIVWRRTVESGTSSATAASPAQALVIPQPDYLRIVHDLQLRSQRIQRRAEQLQAVTEQLGRELAAPGVLFPTASVNSSTDTSRGSANCPAASSVVRASPGVELKNLLQLLARKLKSLKLRQLGMEEELQAAYEIYQQKFPNTQN